MRNNKTSIQYVAVFFILLMNYPSHSQSFGWARKISSSGFNYAKSVAVDNHKNTYTVGTFRGTVDFDPGVNMYNLSASYIDVFIQKLDANGNFVWAKKISSNSFGNLFIEVDNKENLYISGEYIGVVDFDPNSGIFNLSNNNGGVFIQKISSSGNLIWVKSIDLKTNNDIEIHEIKIDSSENIYVLGDYNGKIDCDPGLDSVLFIKNSYSVTSSFLIKLDSLGKYVWAKNIGGVGQSYSNVESKSLTIDMDENVYTTGVFSGKVDFNPNVGCKVLNSDRPKKVFIQKLDSKGNFVFVKMIGGFIDCESNSINSDKYGNIYLTGEFYDTVDFDPNIGVYELHPNYNDHTYILKLNKYGNFMWAKNFVISYKALSTIDNNCNIYTTGSFRNLGDFDPNNGVFNMNNKGHTDAFIQKLDENGDFVWAVSFGDKYFTQGSSISTDNENNVYVVGHFTGVVDFDPSINSYNLASNTSDSPYANDAFIVKLGGSYTSIKEKIKNINFKLLPNPTKGKFKIEFDENNIISKLIIIDFTGKLIYETHSYNEIDISSFPNGLYFVKILFESGQLINRKLILSK